MPKNQKQIQRFARITLPDGSKKRIAARGKTEREALQKLAELKADYAAGLVLVTKASPFERYAEEYLEIYKRPKVDPATFANEHRRLQLYFYPHIGCISLEKLTTSTLQQCLNEMQEKGLSQDYIKKAYNLVFAVLDQARKDRLLLYNVAENCTVPQGKPPKSRRALTEAERQLFLTACAQSPKGANYLITYYCGLRPAEVKALRWANIDFKAKTITVTNRADAKSAIKSPKSKAGYRTIPIPDALMVELLKLPRNIDKNAFVFGDEKPQTKQNYERGWRNIKRHMNIAAGAILYRNQIVQSVIDDDISPYYLRHTYCTMLAEIGIPLKTAQYLMGHSSVELTANIYTHLTPKLIADATPLLATL